jgi:ABC-type uncharacterized transport system permease subunit
MTHTAISSILTLLALLAFSAILLAPSKRQSVVKELAALSLGTLATVCWIWSREWGLGLPTAILASVLATEIAFGLILLRSREAIQLGSLLGPYLFAACLLVLWVDAVGESETAQRHISGWLGAHISAAVLSYGFVTIGAIGSLGIIMRERGLKRRTRGRLTDRLPSIAVAETTEIIGLTAAEIILGIGIIFGIAAEYTTTGAFFQITHKSLFSVTAFVVIGGLLILHLRTGLRGRLAARIGLSAYLLVSLGYPGVKFVSDIFLS